MSYNCPACKKYHYRQVCQKCHHKCCDDKRVDYIHNDKCDKCNYPKDRCECKKNYYGRRGYDDYDSSDSCNTCYYPKDKSSCKKEYYNKDKCNKCYYPKKECDCGKEVFHHDKCSKCYEPKRSCKCRQRSYRSYKCRILDNFNAREIARLHSNYGEKCENKRQNSCKVKCCCKKVDLVLKPIDKPLKAKFYNKKCGYYLCHWDRIRDRETTYDTYTVMLCGSPRRDSKCVDVVLNLSTGKTDELKCGDVKYELCVTRVCGKRSVSCVEGCDTQFVQSTPKEQQGNPYSLRWCNVDLGVDRTILAFRRVVIDCVEEYHGFKPYPKPVCIEEVCVYED